MANAKTYDMTVYPTQAAVRSEHDGAKTYLVQLPFCPCADFTNRRGEVGEDNTSVTVCKHIVRALALVGGHHGTPEPEPVPETYTNLSYEEALTQLEASLVSHGVAVLTLSKVHAGRPSLAARPGKPAVVVTQAPGMASTRRYDVTVPA